MGEAMVRGIIKLSIILFVFLWLVMTLPVIVGNVPNAKQSESKPRAPSSSAQAQITQDSFQELTNLMADVVATLDSCKDELKKHRRDESTKQEQAFLDGMEKCVDGEFQRFTNPEVMFRYETLKKRQIEQLREQARVVRRQILELRATIKSRTREIHMKELSASLDSKLLDALNELRNAMAYKSYFSIAIIIFCTLLLGGAGYWGYRLLQSKRLILRKRILEQPHLFLQLMSAFGKFRESIKQIIARVEKRPEQETAEKTSTDRPKTPRSPTQALIDLYNAVVYRSDKIGDFWKSYENRIVTLGLTNAKQRVENNEIPPEFGEADNGEYYAVEIEPDQYAVVPRFGLLFSKAKYQRGGLGFVFQCRDAERGHEGSAILLKQPALFRNDTQSNSWSLQQRGEISLGTDA